MGRDNCLSKLHLSGVSCQADRGGRHLLNTSAHAGNFMLLNEDDRSPLKAIDFGLAVSYDPHSLPRSDLGLEGTPW